MQNSYSIEYFKKLDSGERKVEKKKKKNLYDCTKKNWQEIESNPQRPEMASRIQRENKTLVLVPVMGTSADPERPTASCLPGYVTKEQG